jgi:hypothetical protein
MQSSYIKRGKSLNIDLHGMQKFVYIDRIDFIQKKLDALIIIPICQPMKD